MAGQLILAADGRARGIVTIERYRDYLSALSAAIPACDGVVASAQPLGHLVTSSTIAWDQRSYLSINQTGLAGSAFESLPGLGWPRSAGPSTATWSRR